MQQDQNIHVLWQIRACAVCAVYLPLLGLLTAWGRGGGTRSSTGSQHHSVGVSGAKAQHTPGNFGISVDCVWL